MKLKCLIFLILLLLTVNAYNADRHLRMIELGIQIPNLPVRNKEKVEPDG